MSRSTEGKFLDKLKSFYYLVCVCVCVPPYPLFLKNQLVLVSCISCVKGKKSVPVRPELKDSGPKSILLSCVVALRVDLCFEQK